VNGFDLLTTASVAGKRMFRCGAIQVPSLVVNLLRRRQQQNALSMAKRGKEEHLPALIDNPDREELIQTEVSREIIESVRSRMAAFDHRRADLYR
jgi:hypothetical protein